MQLAATTRDLVLRRKAVSQRLAAAEAGEEPDYALIGRLIMEHEELEQEASQLVLTDGDYAALSQRHPVLVQEVRAMCRDLAIAKQYSALRDLATQLAALKAAGRSLLPAC